MKKICALFIFAAALAVACTGESAEKTPPGAETPSGTDPANPGSDPADDGPQDFEASFGETVKSSLDGTRVLWEVDDEISIMWDGGSVTAKSPSAGAKTTFTAEVGEAEVYYAVYPASAGATLSGETISLAIPSSQHGRFAEANIAVARSKAKANTFLFRNLCALGSFSLSRDDIAEVTVSPNAEGVLAGEVSITLATTGMPDVDAARAEASNIVLTPVSGTAFAPGTYYFCTMKASFAEGINFTFKTSSGEVLETKASFPSADFERSGLLAFGTVDDSSAPGPDPDPGAEELKLTFDFAIGETARAGSEFADWPLARVSKPFEEDFAFTVTPTYPLDGTDYSFELITPGSYENQPNKTRYTWSATGTRFILFQYGLCGLPAIEEYKLSQVTVHHGMTTAATVGICKALADYSLPVTLPSESDYVTGGASQTYSKTVETYTYELEGTEANTRYYLCIPTKEVGIDQLDLTYVKVPAE